MQRELNVRLETNTGTQLSTVSFDRAVTGGQLVRYLEDSNEMVYIISKYYLFSKVFTELKTNRFL